MARRILNSASGPRCILGLLVMIILGVAVALGVDVGAALDAVRAMFTLSLLFVDQAAGMTTLADCAAFATTPPQQQDLDARQNECIVLVWQKCMTWGEPEAQGCDAAQDFVGLLLAAQLVRVC